MTHSLKINHILMLALFLAIALAGCATVPKEVLYPGAPTLLPGTESRMNTPGYWISLNPDPDRVILDREGIASLNALIRTEGFVRDLAAFQPMKGDDLKKDFENTAEWIGGAKVFQQNGKKVNAAFMAPLIEQMDSAAISDEGSVRYGFLATQADMRVLPTSAPLYDGPGDLFVDNLQASSLDEGTPVIIVHQSKDGSWFYAVTELIVGWIPASCVAVADKDIFLGRYSAPEKLIVTECKADIFADEKLTRFIGSARMGTPLVAAERMAQTEQTDTAKGRPVKILFAGRDEDGNYSESTGWVEADNVSSGYLDYTARTIYRQAFRLLNTPYGWGGSFGEQDCSQFLCEIFSTAGIMLPRNSARQALVGSALPGFTAETGDAEKMNILLDSGIPGATLLRLPGHIMLYLGTVDGKPYIIHSTWAYREKRGSKEIVRLINRVTVSNLELGNRTAKGTHLHRLTAATVITLPPE